MMFTFCKLLFREKAARYVLYNFVHVSSGKVKYRQLPDGGGGRVPGNKKGNSA
jgi:hypothetical protein